MSVRMRAGRPFCLAVAFDHPGQNGEGKMGCLPFNGTDNSPAASFMQLPRLTLRQTVPLEDGSDSTPRTTKSAADLLVEAPPAWGNHLRIPSYTLKTRASPEDEGAQTHAMQASGGDGGARQPILPSIFVPGFPKSATTWLYTCISDAFAPHRVGCGEDASRWNASACSRSFLLTAVTAERWLRGEFLVEQKKETFFFGGTRQRFFRSDLLTFVGPDSAKAVLRANDPTAIGRSNAPNVCACGSREPSGESRYSPTPAAARRRSSAGRRSVHILSSGPVYRRPIFKRVSPRCAPTASRHATTKRPAAASVARRRHARSLRRRRRPLPPRWQHSNRP